MYKGKRDDMEDFILIDKIEIGEHTGYLFCVIDGHGGKNSAKYFTYNYSKALSKTFQSYKILNKFNISEGLTKSIILIENEIKNLNIKDGAVLSFVYYTKDHIYLCHLGDSFIEVFNKRMNLYSSEDHDLYNAKEKKRVEKYGYILNNRVCGILQPSRCIGDFFLKNISISQDIMKNSIIPLLEIKTINNNSLENKTILIISTDGLHFTFNRKDFKKKIDIIEQSKSLESLKNILINKEKLIDNLALILIEINK